MIGNYQLLRTLLDHDEPSRIPSFHLGYASQVLEQGLLEYSEPQDADVCLYIDNGPLPRQNTIDLTIDHVLGYTGHYRGVGPAETRSVPPNYVIDRENLPFEQRFVNASDIPAPARDAKDSKGRPKVLHVGFFGQGAANRVSAKATDEGFSSFYADGLLAPDTFDDFLALHAYLPQSLNLYAFLGRFTADLQTRYTDWSFPAIGSGGLADTVIMALQGNFGAFARWARQKPDFIDKVTKVLWEIMRDCVYVPLLEAGVPIIYWGEDLGQKERLLLSPELHRRFFAPYLKEFCNLVHSYDARVIMHSDGNVTEIIPTLLECGIDGLQALEPASGMQLGELCAVYQHRLAFFGALDQRVLCWGTVQDTIEMVKKAISDGKDAGGLFALGPSHQPIGARPENIFAMMETIKKFG
ncbi:MAG TPA: uroporphyrinogen decarboxylase family protein [Candidatus Lokiarchaeia archaeon]|nr:uroporphyrinogen decarboxylase family protein [Candidatus Lokiarchaeia archaeon]